MAGIGDQSLPERIGVHVGELLDFLLATPYVEIVETFLPELPFG